ncbi:rhomboid family GlyGly-CTERM serine protease [Ereboglobus sp. PH5-10]|uniref:rhombosortase n=1 Tax=Ereboglobus sp. PH5-10 TaxID=2940629 RepID=UPI002405C015|nr:rhombosortase [Ereboglobus sp. PH5-10]MDF9826055.1 rhomboid family GlyGly-CTERM serine protease [Ereboglobus sp. PH5-10]
MIPPFSSLLKPRLLPWLFLPGGVLALVAQSWPELARALVYDRSAIIAGEWWRMWTGNFVHFGWVHFALDTGLYFLIGWALVYRYRWWLNVGWLVLMPLAVTTTIFIFDADMIRYGGLSGANVGWLVMLAFLGWQQSWRDWFWPVFLGIHVAELIYEARLGGRGGGMIKFDDPNIRVATLAHIGGAAFGIVLWGVVNLLRKHMLTPEAAADDAAEKRPAASPGGRAGSRD